MAHTTTSGGGQIAFLIENSSASSATFTVDTTLDTSWEKLPDGGLVLIDALETLSSPIDKP